MLPNVVDGSARRCHAKAKSTGQQCKNPAAHKCSTCRNHGARRPENIIKGDKHHWFVHGESTRKLKREMPAINARLKALGKALLTGNYDDLPFDPKLEKLKAEYAAVLKKQGIDLSPKPTEPITTLAQARAAIVPKQRKPLTPKQREKVAAYQKIYQPAYRAKQKALKAQAKHEAELERQLYLKSTRSQNEPS